MPIKGLKDIAKSLGSDKEEDFDEDEIDLTERGVCIQRPPQPKPYRIFRSLDGQRDQHLNRSYG